jgi:hypothetical protein
MIIACNTRISMHDQFHRWNNEPSAHPTSQRLRLRLMVELQEEEALPQGPVRVQHIQVGERLGVAAVQPLSPGKRACLGIGWLAKIQVQVQVGQPGVQLVVVHKQPQAFSRPKISIKESILHGLG